MAEFLDFKEISQQIPFTDLLDYLNIPYTVKGKEIRGEGFDFIEQTGCRISEALRLRFEDIQEGFVTLWTRKAKNSNLTPRRIPIPECLIGKKGTGQIFSRWNNKPKFLERYVRRLGLNRWNWHNLRHRRVSLWAKEGRTLLEIMQLLGHSNLSTTQKYLQILGHIKL